MVSLVMNGKFGKTSKSLKILLTSCKSGLLRLFHNHMNIPFFSEFLNYDDGSIRIN